MDARSARWSPVVVLLVVIALLGFWALAEQAPPAAAQPTGDTIIDDPQPPLPGWYAKFDGIDGESDDVDHDMWIEILSVQWGAHKPVTTGQSRRRGATVVDGATISFFYEKAAPKIEEATFFQSVIPTLEVELLEPTPLSARRYLKWEMTNVSITDFQIAGEVESGERPVVTVTVVFEEITVTYTEYGDDGGKAGDIEYEWNVERGGR